MKKLTSGFTAAAIVILAGCGTTQIPGINDAPATLKYASKAEAHAFQLKLGHGLGWNNKGTTPIVNDLGGATMPGFQVQDDAALPAKVDIRNLMSPIADQGQLGACTGFAIVKGYGEFNELQKIRADGGDATKDFVPLSAGYLYWQERAYQNTTDQDSGAQVFMGMRVLTSGVAPDELYPYPTAAQQNDPWFMKYWFGATPSAQADYASTKFAGGRIQSVEKLSQLKESLAAGYPVAFGFLVFPSMINSYGDGHMSVPNLGAEAVEGGHAVLAVGYDDDAQEIIFRNSWGTDVGDKGYFYMPYKYFDAQMGLADDGWTMKP